MPKIVFVDELPAGKRTRKGETQEFVDALKTRPNTWAIFRVVKTEWSGQYTYRKRYPGTQWAVRRNEAGHSVVYGRWIGVADNA